MRPRRCYAARGEQHGVGGSMNVVAARRVRHEPLSAEVPASGILASPQVPRLHDLSEGVQSPHLAIVEVGTARWAAALDLFGDGSTRPSALRRTAARTARAFPLCDAEGLRIA